jgi:ABC transport system ATP-binding/permease protein
MFKLVIQDDEGKTTVVPLIRDEITIGRKEGNTIRLTERNVSRRHARILRSNNEVQIEDLGSYNGIRVNNARIAERVSLRISDQVQIGDYKLYLKAEGVEQVDDARTMPIERVGLDGNGVPTDGVATPQQAAASPGQIPTTPMPAVQRAGLAVADTDPAGRPVATAAQVAALTAPAGYGKFIVISSNFPGKELELTRPQMIIGRTDENDLVINHRSISRNHAKVTRDPETQRYTISDLQSSNGVRVNGQDYGKVELRRADIVDLGHVRMRFVEPGEDYDFARDGVVTDVPETGSRKGMLVAVVLAIVVLGAVAAFFLFKKDSGESTTHTATDGSGSSVPVVTNGSGSGVGSNALAVVEIDAGVQATVTDPQVGSGVEGDCLDDITKKDWHSLETCADQLDGVHKGAGQTYRDRAKLELGAQQAADDMLTDLKTKNLKDARKHLDKIPAESGYYKDAKKAFDDKKLAFTNEGINHARGVAKTHKCDDMEKYIVQEGSALGDDIAAAISAAVKCEPLQAVITPPAPPDCTNTLVNANDKRCKTQFCATHEASPACGGGAVVAAGTCESLTTAGRDFETTGDHVSALKKFEDALRACNNDPYTLKLTFMAACNGGNLGKAKQYWKRLTPEGQGKLAEMCVRNHITRDQLDGPP